MTDDFTARLRLQLREAALREEDRGGLARAATAVRTRPSLAVGSFAAALAVGLVLVLGLWMVASTDTETTAPDAGPRVVRERRARRALGPQHRGRVRLRVAVRDERREHPARRPADATGDGADPRSAARSASPPATARSGRSRARPGVPDQPADAHRPEDEPRRRADPDGAPRRRFPFGGGFIVVGPRVWVIGGTSVLAVDPTRNRPVREVELGGSYQVNDASVRDGELWLTRGDRTITRLDAVTGRRLGRVPWPGPPAATCSRTPTSWSRSPPLRRARRAVDGAAALADAPRDAVNGDVAGGRLYVEGLNGASSRDTLWELDPRAGRVPGTLTVPVFSVVGSAAVGRTSGSSARPGARSSSRGNRDGGSRGRRRRGGRRGARDLARVEEVVGVERALDRAHQAHAGGAVLELEVASPCRSRRRARRCRCRRPPARRGRGGRGTPSPRATSAGSSRSMSSVTWKLPSPTWPRIGAGQAVLVEVGLRLG